MKRMHNKAVVIVAVISIMILGGCTATEEVAEEESADEEIALEDIPEVTTKEEETQAVVVERYQFRESAHKPPVPAPPAAPPPPAAPRVTEEPRASQEAIPPTPEERGSLEARQQELCADKPVAEQHMCYLTVYRDEVGQDEAGRPAPPIPAGTPGRPSCAEVTCYNEAGESNKEIQERHLREQGLLP